MGTVTKIKAAITDRLMNVVSGLGYADKDKKISDLFGLVAMDQRELEAAYRSDWVARKIIDQVVRDMTRQWRTWQGTKTQITKLEETERRLQYRKKVARAKALARLYGGSVMIAGDGTSEPTSELTPDSIGAEGLKFIHVLHRHEITPSQLERDPMSPFFGEPKYYELQTGAGASVRIHPSRVQRFIGAEVPDHNNSQTNGWGDSILQSLYDAVKAAASVQENIASLIGEAKLDIIKIPGMMEQVASEEYQTRLTSRLRVAMLAKSNLNTLLMDGEEEWEQRQLSFSGMPEIIRAYLDIACAAAGYPVALFEGMSPGGLNATGLSDIRNYYDRVASEQDSDLRPELSRFDELLIRSALGRRPASVHYTWNTLWQLSDTERADIGLLKAQATNLYGRLGVMSRDALATAVQNQLIEDAFYPGLDEILTTPEAKKPSEPIAASGAPADDKKPKPTAKA
jgi:phage-related protein (TIGR01555 family)